MERVTKLGLVGLAFVIALTGCSKGSSSSSTSEENASPESSVVASTGAEASPGATESAGTMAAASGNGASASDGAKVYQTNCSSCHQANGQGVEGTFPPLAGNPVVTGDPKQVIHIVKYGLNGSIQVSGHTFNGMMPAWGQQLSNADVAAVITYIRSSWGNSAPAVSESDVAGVSQ
jgi:mono/diheme cytochrome c family protein